MNLENIVGYPIPTWVSDQLRTRSKMLSKPVRDNDNLLFIANRTGWVRVMSGIDGATVSGTAVNAQDYVLFGGTSKYYGTAGKYALRGMPDSYALVGNKEIVDYGYRPMPGITNARIVTQGKLGSLRVATINFKVHDKYQLDIVDALYFKMGYSILIDWGHTTFYKNGGSSLASAEDYGINAFQSVPKETMIAQMNQQCLNSNGNYDAMFGIITNFNFSFTKEGVYDCTIVAMGLGVVAESVKMNNINTLPNYLAEEIKAIFETTNAYVVSEQQMVQTSAGTNTKIDPNKEGEVLIKKPADVDVKAAQDREKSLYSSYIECMLRAVQLHTINKLGNELPGWNPTKNNPVYVRNLKASDLDFLKSIFANGGLQQLAAAAFSNPGGNFENSYYGYSKALLECPADQRGAVKGALIPPNYDQVLNAIVVGYKNYSSSTEGITVKYPVYIPLSFFYMMVNHCSLLYERDRGNIPLFYIDFNPNTNIGLVNPSSFSADPFRFLVAYEGDQSSYDNLYDPKVLAKMDQSAKWKVSQDRVSGPILNAVGAFHDTVYRGKFMNVLVSIDYLLGLMKDSISNDDSHRLNLRNLLETIIGDVNKSFGNFNAFRLSYSDYGNVFFISDDQSVPGAGVGSGYYEVPLYGLKSIAEDITIKTDISTNLANMIAIAANADVKATAGTDATPLGIGRGTGKDRFKTNVTAPSDEKPEEITDTTVEAADQVNDAIKGIYFTGTIDGSSVSTLTNYLIERFSKVKSSQEATRASMIIPVMVNFTTDGISGLGMMQGFQIPESTLPYAYSSELKNGEQVGFLVSGLEHTIESNRWRVNIKANMFYIRNPSSYGQSVGTVSPTKTTTGGGFGADAGQNAGTNSTTTPTATTTAPITNTSGAKPAPGVVSGTVNPNVTRTLADVKAQFPDSLNTAPGAIGIWPSADHLKRSPNSDHNTGDALDLGVRSIDKGTVIANKLAAEASQRGIKQIIFNGQVWNAKEGWHQGRGLQDQHTDHIHVGFTR